MMRILIIQIGNNQKENDFLLEAFCVIMLIHLINTGSKLHDVIVLRLDLPVSLM